MSKTEEFSNGLACGKEKRMHWLYENYEWVITWIAAMVLLVVLYVKN